MSTFSFPAFFCMPHLAGRGRTHVAWPVVAPELQVKRSEANAVTRALSEKVQDTLTRDPEFAPRLGLGHDGAPGDVQIEVPWRKGRTMIRTPALTFTAGLLPRKDRRGRAPEPQSAEADAAQHWVALPRFHVVLPCSPDDPDVLQSALDGHLRRHGHEVGEVSPDAPEDGEISSCGWVRQRGDRFVWMEVRATLPEPPLESGGDIFRLLFGGSGDVSGPAELRKVSTCLNDLHPDGLMIDAVPDERVPRLSAWLFDDAEPVPTAIIGPRGSGRSTLIHAAVRRRLGAPARQGEPQGQGERLARVHHLDPNRVISGMSRLGQWETRLTAILKHVARPGGEGGGGVRHALWVDNAVALARIGRSRGSALSLTRLIRPWIADRRFPFLVEATAEEWTRLEELDRGFTDLFQRIRVEPPARERALRILLSAAEGISKEEGRPIELGGIRAVLDVEARFPSGRGAPGGLMDRLRRFTRAASESVDHWEVTEATQDETGFNERVLDGSMMEDAPAWIARRLAGQPEIETAMLELLATLGAGLVRPGRPVASWLMVGPTGVGKTEAGKVLNELLFNAPERLIRLDMNEYVDGAAVSRLLGVGDTGGTLTGRVRAQPSAIVLLDEIEKAHPSVHDLLLQVLDEGWLGDSDGRRVDFSRTVVLMTSNVGAQEVARATGFGVRDGSAASRTLRAQAWRSAIEASFRPELVNRIGRVILFRSLDQPTVREIAARQLQRIVGRDGFLRRTFLLQIEPEVIDALAVAGFDPDLGARAMKRVLEQQLVQPVAEIFASLPVAEPVRVRVRVAAATPGSGGVGITSLVERWRFSSPIEPAPQLEPATEASLRVLREQVPDVPLRASIGPGGTTVAGAREFALRESVDALLAELPEDTGGMGGAVDLRAQEVERLRGRTETAGGHRGSPRGGPLWDQAANARSVREFLLTLPLHQPDPGQLGRSMDQRTFRLKDRLRCLLRDRKPGLPDPPAVRLCIRPLVDHQRMQWPAFLRYLKGLGELVHGFGATVVGRTWRGGWRVDHPEQLAMEGAIGTIWDVSGLPDARWLDPELGGHVCYPPGLPPAALVVQRVDPALPPAELAAWLKDPAPPADPVIVRLLVPLPEHKNALRITDLRLGETHEVEDGGEGRLLERLWYPVYGSPERAHTPHSVGQSGGERT